MRDENELIRPKDETPRRSRDLINFIYIYNIVVVAFCFCQVLADVFQDLLCNREDYLRAVRALMREIVKAARHDFNFTEFALGLMEERDFHSLESAVKVRRGYFEKFGGEAVTLMSTFQIRLNTSGNIDN